MLCADVEDVDDVYNALTAKGVEFIMPPVDQHWVRRKLEGVFTLPDLVDNQSCKRMYREPESCKLKHR